VIGAAERPAPRQQHRIAAAARKLVKGDLVIGMSLEQTLSVVRLR
jgi:hypothetical protein